MYSYFLGKDKFDAVLANLKHCLLVQERDFAFNAAVGDTILIHETDGNKRTLREIEATVVYTESLLVYDVSLKILSIKLNSFIDRGITG